VSAPAPAAPFGAALPLGARPLVLVVDLMRGFTDPACVLGAELDAEVLATARLLEVARRGGVPVVFTAIAYADDLADGGLWVRKAPGLAELREGTPWVDLDPRLGRQPSEALVVKKGASALFGTNLIALLAERSVDTVIVCGASTSGCVRATVVDLVQHGLPAIVPRECVGDRDGRQHEASLVDIDLKYGQVVSLREALDYVGGARADA
jgi:nicotinamidase-related amidase